MSRIQVVIPVAGYGTRLRPHTYIRPKPLLGVAGKPILGHIVDQLKDVSVEDVTFITGHLGDQVESWARESCPYPTNFVVQTELRGQAHAISLVREHLHGPTLIIFGDTIFEADLSVLSDHPDDGVLFVREVDDPRRFGVAVLRDGFVERLVEKPKDPVSNLAVVGIYYVRDSGALMSAVEEIITRGQQIGGEFYLADALQTMIDRGARFRVAPTPVWADCGTVDALLDTNRFLLEHGHSREPQNVSGVTVVAPAYVDPSATIVDSTIGPHATIGPGVRIERSIVRDSIVSNDARIERSEITHSLIGARAVVEGVRSRLNIADDSVVAEL